MGTADQNNENAPIAFALVVGAGLSTGIGAGFVFNKRLVKLASKRFLAGSLGVAAGVMLYVSLVEIFVKSQDAFANHGYSEADAYMYATLSLFGGILFYKGIDFVVHLLEGGPVGDHNVDIDLYDLDAYSPTDSPRTRTRTRTASGGGGGGGGVGEAGTVLKKEDSGPDGSGLGPDSGAPSATVAPVDNLPRVFPDVEKPPRQQQSGSGAHHHPNPNPHRRRSSRDAGYPREHDVVVELSNGGSIVHPSPDLHTLQLRMAGRVQQQQQQQASSPVSALTPAAHGHDKTGGDGGGGESFMEEGRESGIVAANGGYRAKGAPSSDAAAGAAAETDTGTDTEAIAVVDGDQEKLVRMGVMTAVAIGIHNFPEGLATFVAALSDPSVGFALAVAIAIHNIPEGLCVAIPVYYATGNRWKAFGWALLSGVSEPIGAGLGWLILKDVMSELVYGILFGVVAGMMVNITIHELIPTAVRYDPGDKVTTNSIIVGMAVMALSLTLFLY